MVFDDLMLERQKNAKLIIPEIGTTTWIVFTWCRTILDFRVKLYEKTQTLFACSDKKNINHTYNDNVSCDIVTGAVCVEDNSQARSR